MLKKLVKYGNSNALILDRAILELLNISEGAVVKLHTDGKSLVITPHEVIESKEAFMAGLEKVSHSIESEVEKQTIAIKADPVKNQEMEKWMPGTENFDKLTKAFQAVTEKYRDEMAKLQTEAFSNDVDALAEKYHGDRSTPEFVKELLIIRQQHAPKLADMDKEMQQVKEAFGMPDYL